MNPIQELRKASSEAAKRPARQRMQAAHDAPRCQHIRFNGQRCAAPALRGQTLCYFHDLAQDPDTYDQRWLPLIEDATSLQIAIARVQRFLLMDCFEFKRATALLYSLQIACMNLKNLKAENPCLAPAEDELRRLEVTVADKQPDQETGGKGKGQAVAEAPAAAPAKGENAGPPRLEDPEDPYVVALRTGKAPAIAPRTEKRSATTPTGARLRKRRQARPPAAAMAGSKCRSPAASMTIGTCQGGSAGRPRCRRPRRDKSSTAGVGCAACSRR